MISRLLLFLAFLTPYSSLGQTVIEGTVRLDSTWSHIVYCSRISTLDDMYRCNPNMIIGEAKVIEGKFRMEIQPFLENELVRLHVSKEGAPVANLIIGGDEENFGFYGISPDEHLELSPQSSSLFSSFNANSKTNRELEKVWNMVDDYQAAYLASKSAESKLKASVYFREQMFQYADTAELSLPSILALHEASLSGHDSRIEGQWENVAARFGEHPYLPQLNFRNQKSLLPWLGVGFLLLVIGDILYLIKVVVIPKRKVEQLSVQERKVADLINKGLTNKDIAHELNVEVSTVKSHVYRIFNKLKIKSRNELIQYRKFIHG